MFNRIMIANRGEIACRVIKTAQRLGIEAVAVYSTADSNSLHVRLADAAYCIGEAPACASYLNIEAIINAAKRAQVEAIHPGYGFLSENPAFAEACEAAGIVFVGPSVAALNAMGSKQLAKQLLEKTAVPLVPGYHGKDQSEKTLLTAAKKIGFPVLLKAASGGGGKGMRIVHHAKEWAAAFSGAKREAMASFHDDTMIIEKYLNNPRHIEVQLMADNFGNIVHLFERDCSIQRRHQKIIEEAPAPNLPTALREKITTAAIEVAHTIEYRNAGTVEFIVDDNAQCYFMEMNTRLQVEHPVTEMITNMDLVALQLQIAANQPLTHTQQQIEKHGHAIECRIYAEDPLHAFMPSTGTIDYLYEPHAEGIRIDSGITNGSGVSVYYDPMVAKLIAWGENREQAIQRLQHALKHYAIGGIKTNIAFLQSLCAHPAFIDAHLNTHFLTQYPITPSKPDTLSALYMAACHDYATLYKNTHDATIGWQMHLTPAWPMRYVIAEQAFTLLVKPIDHEHVQLTVDCKTTCFTISYFQEHLCIDDGIEKKSARFTKIGDKLQLFTDKGRITIAPYTWQKTSSTDTNHSLSAPMPATVVAVLKEKGDKVRTGEHLLVLEAMKMEHTIIAPKNGILSEIFYGIGAQVAEGAELVALTDEAL